MWVAAIRDQSFLVLRYSHFLSLEILRVLVAREVLHTWNKNNGAGKVHCLMPECIRSLAAEDLLADWWMQVQVQPHMKPHRRRKSTQLTAPTPNSS